MSTTIDQNVVEMRFDNKQFEQNVATSMSTLDKLKQSLNLSGAAKGLENVGAAAKGINLLGLGTAAETVAVKFSHMQMTIQHQLDRIVDGAVAAGKRIVSALTIDPVKTGLNEYETQINAVQTILANTESKGTTLGQVNSALDTLNTYADKTIYNFTEMTRNIGTFTAAGVDLDTSVNAIQGIANLAAVSGSSSQQASTAMYQLSQALSSGTVKLMDWNSVVNAGMGGQVFQDALKETARVHGIAIDDMIKKNGSFRETLQEGWLSADILTETLSHFTMAAEEGSAEWEKYKQSLMDDGYSEKQATAILKLSNTATDAATKVKTATQLWDTLKETAQSGWTQTWEIILGDFEEAKELFSGIYETLSPMLEASAKSRNELLEGALSSNWDKMITKINDAGIETTKFEEKLRATAEAHGIDVDKMIEDHGSLEDAFRSGAISSDILREAVGELEKGLIDLQSIERDLAKGDTGDDVKAAQEALLSLGYDLDKSQLGKFGGKTEAAVKAFQEANDLEVTGIIDEKTLEALDKATNKTEGLSDSVKGLIDDIGKLGGRELLIESLYHIFDAVLSVIKPIKEAFREIFPPTTADQLYSVIKAFHEFTASLTLSETTSDNLKRTFKGLFAILDIVGQAFSAVFDIIKPLFGGLGDLSGGILEVTAGWGDWLVALNESIKTTGFFTNIADKISNVFTRIVEFLSPAVKGIKEFASSIGESFSKISIDTKVRLEPLAAFGEFIMDIFSTLGDIIKKVFPYVSAAASGIGNVIKDLLDTIAGAIQDTDYDAAFDVVNGGIIAAIGAFIAKFINSGADLVGNAGGFLENINNVLTGVTDTLGTLQDSLKADILQKIAIAIGILAASLLVLSLIDSDRLTVALIAISTLFAELMGSMKIFSNITGASEMKGIAKIATALITLSAALLVLSVALKIMSTMSWEEMGVGLITMVVGLGALVGAVNLLPEKKVNAAAKAIKQMSTSMLILAVAIKIMSTMSWEEMGVGLITMVVGLSALVGAVNLLPKDTALRAAGMVGLATAMVILSGALKIMATMSWEEVAISLVTLAGSLLILAGALALMKTAIPGALAMLIVAPALVVLAGALRLMSGMAWDETARGLVALGGSLIIIATALNFMKTAIPGAAALLVATAALAVLAPVLKVLGSMTWEEIARGLVAIAGAFVILGVAGAVLGPLVPAILSLSGALALLGVACVAIGAGVLALGIGLTAIAAAGSGVAVAIVAIVSSIISLIPFLMEQIGVGFIKLCEVISGGAAAICEAFAVVIVALVDALVASVPTIVEGALVLIDELLKALIEYTPTIVSALFDFLIGVINAVAEKLPELIQAGVNLLMSFFTGVVDALSSIDPTALINGIAAVGVLTALVVAMAGIAALTPAALVGVLGMGAVVTELAIVLAAIGAIAQIPGLEWLISEGGSFMQTVGTAIGQFVGGIIGGVGQGISSALPQIGTDLSTFMQNVTPFIEGAKSFDSSTLDGVQALVGVVAALTAVDIVQGLTSWLTGGSSLTSFGEDLAAFGPSMKAYAESIAGIDATAVTASATAAQALAQMTSYIPNEGGLVAWFTGENSISKFGTELVALGMGLRAYSLAITGFNAEAVIASANAATALADMTSHIPNEGGMIAWFTGENSISKFGTELVSLGMSLRMYSLAITGFNAEAVIASANAALALVDMTSHIPNEGGLVAWFTGENSVSKFGNDLVILGASLSAYSNSIAGFNAEAVIASANAAKALVDMTSCIPNEGGLAAWFMGENSISKFSSDLITLGMGLLGFSLAVTGMNIESVTAATQAAKGLAQMSSYIPNEGGVVSWFTGENSIAKFGTELIDLGKGLKGFSDEVEGINAENITAAANAAQALAVMASYIPNEGGLVAWFTGDNSVSQFADHLPTLGKGLKGFSDSVEGISPENITAAAKAAKSLAEMANTTPTDSSKLVPFGTNLVTFGGNLKSYFDKIDGISNEAIAASARAVNTLKNIGSGLDPSKFSNTASAIKEVSKAMDEISTIKATAADGFSSAVKKLAETNVNNMIKAFENAGTRMKNAGKKLVTEFISGVEGQNGKVEQAGKKSVDKFVDAVESKKNAAKQAGKTVVESCASAISGMSSKFKSAGSDLGAGLVQGINSKQTAVYNAAYALGQKAVQGEKDGQKSNSPSKLTIQAGNWLGEGLIIGIDEMGRKVYNAGYGLGTVAAETISNTVSRIADMVNSDIDAQPTISPVLDLSNVQTGISAIGSMFGSSSLGVSANISAINSMMNRNGQNGRNGDIVSAIDKLNKKMDNLGNTTYQIDGITYDDGSNIAAAVQTLTRAALRERRV